jgi:hypothetical protein
MDKKIGYSIPREEYTLKVCEQRMLNRMAVLQYKQQEDGENYILKTTNNRDQERKTGAQNA